MIRLASVTEPTILFNATNSKLIQGFIIRNMSQLKSKLIISYDGTILDLCNDLRGLNSKEGIHWKTVDFLKNALNCNKTKSCSYFSKCASKMYI